MYECEEQIRKLSYTEVGASPVIFSTFLRQWNGLVIEDKDGGFVARGVTSNHIIAFEKADKKTYEGRVTRDAFTTTTNDLTTGFTPSVVNNGKDEEAYYWDTWTIDDTDRAHVLIDNTSPGQAIGIKYPIKLYEKYNNLTKLNALEFQITISGYRHTDFAWTDRTGDSSKYLFKMYNYYESAWETITKKGKSDLKTSSPIVSVLDANSQWYNPQTFIFNVEDLLKIGESDWTDATGYTTSDRVIYEDILYTCIFDHTSDNSNTPVLDATKWTRTVYHFVTYTTVASTPAQFSKLTCQVGIITPRGDTYPVNYHVGVWIWDLSVKATFDEDNEPEYSTTSIASVTTNTITLDAIAGINLPEADGFGVGDIMHIVVDAETYLQTAYDASTLPAAIGALVINITGTFHTLEDFTFRYFIDLFRHISTLSNSAFWAAYQSAIIRLTSADNHESTGITLTRDDIHGWNASAWSITYDATKQRNQLRIIGENVNFLKNLNPDLDPFDLGDEIEIKEDSSIKTLLQASNLADALAPLLENSEVLAVLILNYSNPEKHQSYAAIEVGKTVALKLPTDTDNSIVNYSAGGDGELLIIADDLNNNEQSRGKEHHILMLQRRYS